MYLIVLINVNESFIVYERKTIFIDTDDIETAEILIRDNYDNVYSVEESITD